MRRSGRVLIGTALAAAATFPFGPARASTAAALPSHHLTPGAYSLTASAATVCSPSWPRTGPALTTRTQRGVFARYGLPWSSRTHYTIDLLVPRSLGGTPSAANLWPQPRAGGRQVTRKNQLEDQLHTLVCRHEIGLAKARHAIAIDWRKAYNRYTTGNPPIVNPPATPAPPPPPGGHAPAPLPGSPPGPVVSVVDSEGLATALRSAAPGTNIVLADGRYTSSKAFTVTAACTPAAPCTLTGGRGAVLDGTGLTRAAHYGLHLLGATYWTVSGIDVTNGNKGIVLDAASHDTIAGVEVDHVGDEAVHFRDNSTDDVIRDSYVHDSGLVQAGFGEGIYIGSAKTNWDTWSQGLPDASDRDIVESNVIARTTAENIDIKEGTNDGVVDGNQLDASAISGKNSASSWVDVKGNNWLLSNNRGANPTNNPSFQNGFETHVQVSGDGEGNRFVNNHADMGSSSGFGFSIERPDRTNNRVDCTNVVTGTHAQLANEPCS